MSQIGWLVVGTVVVVLLIGVLSKGLGWIRVDFLKGRVSAKGKSEGATITNVVSKRGNVVASDESGTKADVSHVEADGDIRAEVKAPSSPKR